MTGKRWYGKRLLKFSRWLKSMNNGLVGAVEKR